MQRIYTLILHLRAHGHIVEHRARLLLRFCAAVGNAFLRYYGKAVFEDDYTIANKVLANAPALQKIYNDETGYKLGIFHLENATAEFRNMLEVKERYNF